MERIARKTSVVPRSGCLTTSNAGTPNASSGRSMSSMRRNGHRQSPYAMKIARMSFAGSDG